MKIHRASWTTVAACLIAASCNKPSGTTDAASSGTVADEIAADRQALEVERRELERERLDMERAALEAEKAALRAERETSLADREETVESHARAVEDRQLELAKRDADLSDREEDLARRESDLSDQELELAGREPLDDWEPEPIDDWQEPVADYETFYDDLQPHGSWYETADYGYVYQPTVVVQDSSWRPYTRGRWACTNLGWNWVSDEPFGWACFHYGRWTLLDGRGWVWVPGDEWAPSWVCWREGGDHVGWAPLPPETLCYRGRGWSSSVEREFGIGSIHFTFIHMRHMIDPGRHCLPVAQNDHCIRQSTNVTNIRFHRDRIISGGPRYDVVRRAVGRPWPVYQIETDRFAALKDLAHRKAEIRGNRLQVFAPNLNTRWNGALRPSRVAGKWDDVKVVRAESGIKQEWAQLFRESRQQQKQLATAWTRENADSSGAKKQLEANRTKVADAQRKVQMRQKEMTEARQTKLSMQRENSKRDTLPEAASRATDRKPTLAERQREAVERLRESRAKRGNPVEPKPEVARIAPAERPMRNLEQAPPRQADDPKQPQAPLRDRATATREPQAPARQPLANSPAVADDTARRGRVEALQRQQQEKQAQADAEQNNRQQRMEEARQQREQARGEAEESNRRGQMEEARRQQQEAAREKAEQARQEQQQRQQQMEESRRSQQEEARNQQEQARREAEENNRRQQQEEMRRQQQEQARQQREENARRQQEEQALQQERMREQREERARQQEEARREQEERSRQLQEERARQQEEARREAQEKARQQQEEQQRRQEERAREQQEKQQERQEKQQERRRGG